MAENRKGGRKLKACLRRRVRDDQDGTVAIEFGFLALPFLMLLFGILELAIVFFASAALDHGTSQAARLIRTDQISNTASDAERLDAFREAVCDNMVVFRDCETRLIIDLVSDPQTFNASPLPPPADYDPDFNRDEYEQALADGDTPPKAPPSEQFDSASANATVVLRAQFVHQLFLPGSLTRLANDKNNTRRLTSITAFKNEPF